MTTISISTETPAGQFIIALATRYGLNASAILSGLLCGICDKKRREATPTPATAAPSAPAEGDAEKGINFLLSLNPQQ